MTLERAHARAVALDSRTDKELGERMFGSPSTLFSEIRAYLYRRSDEIYTKNEPHGLVQLFNANGSADITLGPMIDKGDTPEHFHFDSGARLSFALTLRQRERGWQLLTFRYHYQLPASRSPEYIRFDLNKATDPNPLSEPRCHLHPGLEEVRIPIPLHDPFEILDRIFFVLEKSP